MNPRLRLVPAVILTMSAVVQGVVPQPAHESRDQPRDFPGSHHELPGDAPASRPTFPLVPPIPHAGPWRQGAFESVQVNVDALGQNIPGDAANEPSIAVDPSNPNRMVIGWRQFDTVTSNFRQAGWGYSHDGGRTWTFPGVLTPGVFGSDPVLEIDADGNYYYYSLQPDRGPGQWACYLYKSFDGGVTWPQEVYGWGGDKAWTAIDRTGGIGNGHFYAAWDFASCCPGRFTRSTDGGLTFEGPIDIPLSPFFGTLAVGPDGELYISGSGAIVVRSSDAQNPAVTPTFELATFVDLGGATVQGGTPNPGGLLGQVWIDCDRSSGASRGYVYLLASVDPPGPDPLDVMFSRSTDGGTTWSAPIRVNDDPAGTNAWQWFGTMAVAPSGRIDVIWNDTRDDPTVTNSQLYYSNSFDGGLSWSPNAPLSPPFNHFLGYPAQNKLGDYYDMISLDSALYIAYAATFNGEQDVYFLPIYFDCNTNGVPDNEDIASGTSQDCTGNGIPDECEPDCNNNGAADSCDIAAGTSQDCTDDGVPDECDPDCNTNGAADSCDIAGGTSGDCNANDVPDECDISAGAPDCQNNGVPDGCEPDCNENGTADFCDISGGTSPDCNSNSVPDECEFSGGAGNCCETGHGTGCSDAAVAACVCAQDAYCCQVNWDQFCVFEVTLFGCGSCGSNNDCNQNGTPDDCDIASGSSLDCAGDGTPDECEPDCNVNAVGDECDIAAGTSADCDGNGQPDECQPDCNTNGIADLCDLTSGSSVDCDANTIPDDCQPDCNNNGLADPCDISAGTSQDCNSNGVPDDCDMSAGSSADCDANGTPDDCDIAAHNTVYDCNVNGVSDGCDIASGAASDCDHNNIPDECEAELCYSLWDGFEPVPPFAVGSVIGGLDYNGDGIAWQNLSGSATIGNQGCPASTGKALKIVPQTPPDVVISEYFRTVGGALDDGAPLQTLGFDVRSEAQLNPRIDWRLSLRDAASEEDVILIHWASTQSSYPGVTLAQGGNGRGRILVQNPAGSPTFINSGFAIPANSCYRLKVTLDNFTGAVRLYINGTLRVTTTRLQSGALRMDYFRLVQEANGQSSGGTHRLALDNFSLCLTGGSTSPGGLTDCNGNGVMDGCDIASGAAGDCDATTVPDACEHPGDLNCDGRVDAADYDMLRACLGRSGQPPAAGCGPADLDADGDVDCADWRILRDAWTEGSPPVFRRCPQAVPEPLPPKGGSSPMAPPGSSENR